ncbi:hypothetical protein CANARDRAFT_175082 [[Candida] arabinofermentans NRRL YB-2248]|uniref:Protein YTP1-like C-terminal domain-containing protein n=1 Tax=[Candida] arabinofermentans NRRL YB-2248 TaxID=983967 RepID=A0A1E4T390_9ASCO|nr:hypothetical protein CANARDRAFT_175082 [[Candida] arabinofermentans NRRL YB-2248]
MDMAANPSPTETTTDIDYATLKPVAHEAMHMHGIPILQTKLSPAEHLYWDNYNTTTYFTIDSPHKSQLYIHLFLLISSFVFLYPIVLVLNNLNSKWYLPALTLHTILILTSLFSYSIFIDSVPDLYPGNAYTKMNVGLFIMSVAQFFIAILYVAKRWNQNSTYLKAASKDTIEMNNMTFSPSSTLYEFSDNHGSDLVSHDSFDLELQEEGEGDDSSDTVRNRSPSPAPKKSTSSKISSKLDTVLMKLFAIPLINKGTQLFGFIITTCFNLLNFGLMFYFWVLLPTGVSVLNCMGQGNRVFNLLAHFIKGGVFLALGILSLARYSGGFTKLGWAWNLSYISKFERSNSIWYRFQPNTCMITMEMMESSLILFYGSTNIFLEHLAASGGEWTAKDLQHVSIAFMYIGCGLCGVIAELKLANWRRDRFYSQVKETNLDLSSIVNVTPGFSPNPFPAFTIFWTGLLMSSHQQASELSTKIHVQWGSLLTYGSVVRLVTMAMLIYWPKTKSSIEVCKPTRPFTELITSFCLICGGFVFMQSTDQVIDALEWRGLTSMFTLNVSVGIVSLLMAWIMCVFSFKDWLKGKMYN